MPAMWPPLLDNLPSTQSRQGQTSDGVGIVKVWLDDDLEDDDDLDDDEDEDFVTIDDEDDDVDDDDSEEEDEETWQVH
jgi:hypothetical protein